MKTVKIRNIEIGTGIPGTIVPIVERTHEEILQKAGELARSESADDFSARWHPMKFMA